jgi:hypothetical protein
MKSLLQLLLSLLLPIGCALACAQTGAGNAAAPGAGGGPVVIFSKSPNPTFSLAESQKGIPFSADVINESVQVLADGNRIQRETRGKMFCDSEGRTRTEYELVFPGTGAAQARVTIVDPAQRTFISLDPVLKTATVHRVNPQKVAPVPPTSDGVSARPPSQPRNEPQPRPIVNSENLGTKEIEGFAVSGTRMTQTMAAGVIGNEKPLVSVNETWYSKDLRRPLLTVRDDPQSGRHTMRLTNIQTGEPDPLLFQVPPDYTVKEN